MQTGIAVEIEDGGLSLSEEGRARAERMLKEAQAGIDLNDLGETPRLGLAVVGRLAQAYGLQVSLRPSAYGGVRAVLIVPQELITTAPATGLAHGIGASSGPRAAGAARPAAGRAGTGPLYPAARESVAGEEDAPVVSERTPNGLPQRRRHSEAAAAVSAPTAAVPAQPSAGQAEESADGPEQPGLWLAAFQSGVNSQVPDAAPAGRNSDESSGRGEQ